MTEAVVVTAREDHAIALDFDLHQFLDGAGGEYDPISAEA